MTKRDALIFTTLLALLVLAILIGITVGSVTFPLSHTASILLHTVIEGTSGDNPAWQQTIIMWVRLPRVIVGALAGAGLAITGAVMQSVFRNPMAEPGIIGVSAGAALGAVAVLYSGIATLSILYVPSGAFIGALACTILVYSLSASHGKTSPSTLLLAGIAIGSIAIALTSFILALSLKKWEVGRQIISWLMGDLEGRSWNHVALAAPLVISGSLWLMLYARDLNVLLTGEEHAMAVGINVPAIRRNLLVTASLVTAATVSVAGSISFVGLVVPHIVRLLLGPDNRKVLPASLIFGAAFLVIADTLCRYFVIQELRLGIVTSLCGAPFFLYLLLKKRNLYKAL
jgi:iron complex transport system permease protein